MIAFMSVNAINFLVPLSKYVLIYYESELEEYDCGIFNCLWALDTWVGQLNLEVEMYPDIGKSAALIGNFLLWFVIPWVDSWMNGKGFEF